MPLTFGYDQWTYAFRGNTPLYSVGKDDPGLVVAQFGSKKAAVRPWLKDKSNKSKEAEKKAQAKAAKDHPLVLSGGLLSGKKALNGAPAIIRTKVGEGQVIFMAGTPCIAISIITSMRWSIMLYCTGTIWIRRQGLEK